eukprot:10406091-Alexandrium_andersonii.AAC.1
MRAPHHPAVPRHGSPLPHLPRGVAAPPLLAGSWRAAGSPRGGGSGGLRRGAVPCRGPPGGSRRGDRVLSLRRGPP